MAVLREIVLKIGDYFVTPLVEGTVKRDGGVAFGLLPRSIWSGFAESDSENMVTFSLTSFLLQGLGKNILIDTGVGTKLGPEGEALLEIHRTDLIDAMLEDVDLKAADIDMVILTHLHTTAAGGLTRLDDDRVLVPAYPNARVVVQEGEWERAVHANLRTRQFINKEDFEPLLWHQVLDLVEGDTEILPGLHLEVTGGHTKMHQVVRLESQGEGAIFWGGLVPSVHYFDLNTIAADDLYPLRSMERKAELLDSAIEAGWVHFLAHDPEFSAVLVFGDLRGGEGVSFEALLTHSFGQRA